MTVKSLSLVRDDAKTELRLTGRGQVLSVGVCSLQQWEFSFPLFFPLGDGTDGRNSPGEDEFRSEREGESRAWPPTCRPPQTFPPATNILPSRPSVSSRHIWRSVMRGGKSWRPPPLPRYPPWCWWRNIFRNVPASRVWLLQVHQNLYFFFLFPPLNYLGLSFWSSSLTKLAALQNSWKSDLRGCFIYLMLLLLSWPKK